MRKSLVFRHDPGGLARTERRLSLKDVMSETANSLGVAHYDEDISEAISTMRDFVFAQIDVLSRCLCHTAVLTAYLGRWILSKLHEGGHINLDEIA